jgi:hypothetical protein
MRSRKFRSMQLGQAGPRGVKIFSRNHDQEYLLHLTELHESTHFHLINNTTVGQVQHICDGILTLIEGSSDRIEQLRILCMSEASVLDLEATYQLIHRNTELLHEVTASYIEFAFARTFGRQSEFESALVERSEVYGLPIIERCRLFESRLGAMYKSGSFRGNVIYTIAKIALNRRLMPATSHRTLADGIFEIFSSAPPPDTLFLAFADFFEHRWQHLKELLKNIDAAFSAHLQWKGGSAEDLFSLLRGNSQATIANVKNLENLHKVFLYRGLSTLFDPGGFNSHIEAMEHFGTTILPSLSPLMGNYKLEWRIQDHPIKPSVLDPTLAANVGLRIDAGSDAKTLCKLVQDFCIEGFSCQRVTLVVHVDDGANRLSGIEGAIDIETVEGECLFTMIISQIQDGSGDVMRERILFSFSIDKFLHIIPSLTFGIPALIASSCRPESDELAKAVARKFLNSGCHVFFRPHGSMFVETVEFGAYKFQTPAFAAFVRFTEDAAGGGLVLFIAANEGFWMVDQVTETRLTELVNWVYHNEQIRHIYSLPFDRDLIGDMRYAVTSSLLHFGT